MEHFQIKFHLKKAMKKEILGEGTHGIIELYQCKDDHVSEKQTGIETPQENTENRNICNKKFVVKRIKLKKNCKKKIILIIGMFTSRDLEREERERRERGERERREREREREMGDKTGRERERDKREI